VVVRHEVHQVEMQLAGKLLVEHQDAPVVQQADDGRVKLQVRGYNPAGIPRVGDVDEPRIRLFHGVQPIGVGGAADRRDLEDDPGFVELVEGFGCRGHNDGATVDLVPHQPGKLEDADGFAHSVSRNPELGRDRALPHPLAGRYRTRQDPLGERAGELLSRRGPPQAEPVDERHAKSVMHLIIREFERWSTMRIVDFSKHLPGPLAAHLLAELGADVIKVERPGSGDGNRDRRATIAGLGDLHVALNSGTRSLAVDSGSSHWPEIVAACARWADAVIVGARPDSARRRGLDFASLIRHNPRLVYCAISGYGPSGEWSSLPAHGQNVDARAGAVPLDRDGNRFYTRTGWRPVGAPLGGAFAALGILAGLQRRAEHGGAQCVHISLWHCAMWWNWRELTALANEETPFPDYREIGPRYAVYACSDGLPLLVCPIEERFWRRFVEVTRLPARLARRGAWRGNAGIDFGYAEEDNLIASAIAEHTRDRWSSVLAAADIPFAPVLDAAEALHTDHAASSGLLRTTTVADRQVRLVSSPLQWGEPHPASDSEPLPSPPELGEHTGQILAELGLERPAFSGGEHGAHG
jgi:crotonobetainyl-CoA:carnitine CoA-transferase CaiB-like acyl-CoA transferase